MQSDIGRVRKDLSIQMKQASPRVPDVIKGKELYKWIREFRDVIDWLHHDSSRLEWEWRDLKGQWTKVLWLAESESNNVLRAFEDIGLCTIYQHSEGKSITYYKYPHDFIHNVRERNTCNHSMQFESILLDFGLSGTKPILIPADLSPGDLVSLVKQLSKGVEVRRHFSRA